MKDHNNHTVHEGEVVRVINHPEIFTKESWVVIDFIAITKDFVLQEYLSHEIKVFNYIDVERSY